MTRQPLVLVAGFLFLGSLVAAQGPAPASTPARALGDPKPHPYKFVFPRPPVEELKARRAALAEQIKDGAVIVVSSEKPALSSHRYSPDFNTYYLTGVHSDFCAMTLIAKSGKIAEVKIFLPKEDPKYSLWDGSRVIVGDAAKASTGIDDIGAVQGDNYESLKESLTKIASSGMPVFMDFSGGRNPREGRLSLTGSTRNGRIREFLESVKPGIEIEDLGRDIGSANSPMAALRGIKSAWEIGVMREGVRITGEGFVRALRQARPLMWEFDFQAVMDHAFVEWGCTGVPYFPIAASGPNACILHYVDNDRQVKDGEIVLCDIAAQYGYYAGDITRSFPVNGKFTERQKLVYEAVLAGQTAAAAALKPGTNLGMLDGIARKAMRAAGLKDFEMHQHGLGHHVGLHVHDVGGHELQAGMIVTIEPGAYIRKEGLGVRIEDMYLVTAEGNECLSAAIPKTVAELEALVGADWRH